MSRVKIWSLRECAESQRERSRGDGRGRGRRLRGRVGGPPEAARLVVVVDVEERRGVECRLLGPARVRETVLFWGSRVGSCDLRTFRGATLCCIDAGLGTQMFKCSLETTRLKELHVFCTSQFAKLQLSFVCWTQPKFLSTSSQMLIIFLKHSVIRLLQKTIIVKHFSLFLSFSLCE